MINFNKPFNTFSIYTISTLFACAISLSVTNIIQTRIPVTETATETVRFIYICCALMVLFTYPAAEEHSNREKFGEIANILYAFSALVQPILICTLLYRRDYISASWAFIDLLLLMIFYGGIIYQTTKERLHSRFQKKVKFKRMQ